jgi:hypothetical protein
MSLNKINYIMRTILIIVLFLISKISICQPPVGATIYRPELNKFEGTWKFTSSTEEVIFMLKKIHYFSPGRQVTEDVLMGSHKYTKNGVVVEDRLTVFPTIGQPGQSKGSIFLWVDWNTPDPNKLDGSLSDAPKKKRQNFTLEYVTGTPAQLICHITGSGEGFVAAPALPGITLPVDFTLIKQ